MASRLLVESTRLGVFVGEDSTTRRQLLLDVGYKMVAGVRATLYYFRGSERVDCGYSLEDVGEVVGPGRGPEGSLRDISEVAARYGVVQVIREYVIFETDVPVQHRWAPELGRYRVLWRGIAVGTYPPAQ